MKMYEGIQGMLFVRAVEWGEGPWVPEPRRRLGVGLLGQSRPESPEQKSYHLSPTSL